MRWNPTAAVLAATLALATASGLAAETHFTIHKASTPPKLDGILDDESWESAKPLSPFYDCSNGKTAQTETRALLTYDNENIYVAFKNSEPAMDAIKCREKARDGAVYHDDCVEVFIGAPNGNIRHFIVNSIGTKYDARIFMRVPGDPYRGDAAWDGNWECAAAQGNDFWTAELRIPFSDFEMGPAQGRDWSVNLARERKAEPENSHFNRVAGMFNNTATFATLTFSKDTALLSRYFETGSGDPLRVERTTARFKELLSGRAGNYVVQAWSSNCQLSGIPSRLKTKYTDEAFQQEQSNVLAEYAEAGLVGPIAFPWAPNILGVDKVRDFSKRGMKWWLAIASSSIDAEARANGAGVENPGDPTSGVDSNDPKFQDAIERKTSKYLSSNKDILPHLRFISGRDEPMNRVWGAYSKTKNTKNHAALSKLDATVKMEFGFGKFGLYDTYSGQGDSNSSALVKIAFMRWWNSAFANNIAKQHALVKEFAPGIPFNAYIMNCTRGLGPEDISLLSRHSDIIAFDPYPTSSLYSFGRARALYHTGFTTKICKDLTGGRNAMLFVQAFPYCGRTPTPDNLREWGSQGLKNGADNINWYRPSRADTPQLYREMLRLSNIVHKMNKLELPGETKTAVFFSCPSFWGSIRSNADYGANHSWYSVYCILGENLKSWFKFVSDSGIRLKMVDLSKYGLVYVPQIKFTDTETAGMLSAYVRNGGRMVLFDPEAFTWNINGEKLSDMRSELIGCSTERAVDVKKMVAAADYSGLKSGDELPLAPLAHVANAGKVLAFEITPPADAKIIAVYPDRKPAAFERKVGKGSVIYFAAQPFGNSELAVEDSKWAVFMKGLAEQTGEKLRQPIWDFKLPATGGEIDVKYVVSPQ